MKAVVVRDLMAELTGNRSRVGSEVQVVSFISKGSQVSAYDIRGRLISNKIVTNKDTYLCADIESRSLFAWIEKEITYRVGFDVGSDFYSKDELKILEE